MGYGSASAYNMVYYWMNHLRYHSPPRLQVAFHALLWTGLPGLIMGLLDCFRHGPNLPPSQNINIQLPNPDPWYLRPSVIHHHHHHEAKERKKEPKEQKREAKEEEEKDKESTPRAVHEPKSTVLWITLLAGASYSLYRTYEWTSVKCSRLCANVQSLIENVQ